MNFNKILIITLLGLFILLVFSGIYNGVTRGSAVFFGRNINVWHADIARVFTVAVVVHLYTKRKILLNYLTKKND